MSSPTCSITSIPESVVERDRVPRRVDRRDDAVARGEEERRDRVDGDAVAEEAVGEDRVGDPVDRDDRSRQRRLQRQRRLGGSGGRAAWRSFVHGSGIEEQAV